MDAILYWNDVALEANRESHTNGKNEQTGPTSSSRALAIVHLAMYDAFAGVANDPANLPLYLPGLNLPAPGASRPAAVAAAAHDTLAALFPSQKTFFARRYREAPLLTGDGVEAGHTFGAAVARAMLEDRQSDPDASDAGYLPSVGYGRHRVDPDNPGQGFHGPFYGEARCFAVSARHGLDAPPHPADANPAEYLAALREVRGKGVAPGLQGTVPSTLPTRTPEETMIGLYWGYDGASGLGTPPRLYNQIVRRIAVHRGNDEATNARLFAFVNAAMADAGILAWEQKYAHDLWRPVVGIREHHRSMGPGGIAGAALDPDCDPQWLPLGAPSTNGAGRVEFTTSMHAYPCQSALAGLAKNFTPPFPAYPSGHATFGAAALHTVRLFYGTPSGDRNPDTHFDGLAFESEELNGFNKDNAGTVRPRHVRTFPGGLWQMIEENGFSRVLLGVHWVFDAFAVDGSGSPDYSRNIGGAPLGLAIAEDIFVTGNEEAPRRSTV